MILDEKKCKNLKPFQTGKFWQIQSLLRQRIPDKENLKVSSLFRQGIPDRGNLRNSKSFQTGKTWKLRVFSDSNYSRQGKLKKFKVFSDRKLTTWFKDVPRPQKKLGLGYVLRGGGLL